ncbi:cellulase family glycosylhydrolase [Planctomycetales bacterium ZRK34]|nr:cellulase family glycosylhydrolase [Planctomycetales bacterium ZRK34]
MFRQLVISAALTAFCVLPGIATAEEYPPLFPFLISYDAPDNASSVAHLLDAPAGKHGFVRVKNDRFVTDAGPIRLNATNLTGPANFPSHEDADQLAGRLARFGINCVRLHYFDAAYGNFLEEKLQGIIADDPNTQRNLDPTQLERFDYMIAAFKKRGIYVNINLHVARKWDDRDGFSNTTARPGMDKSLDNFEPRMIELQKEYARKLLTHVNPYTGLAYANDPCVAMVELNNENALMRGYVGGWMDRLPDPYAAEFHRQWNQWLAKKYASTNALRSAWKWVDTPLSHEQVSEGSFDQPVSIDGKTWILSRGSAQASCDVDGGVFNINVTRDGHEYYPKLFRNLSVVKGQPYTLSFRIRQTKGSGRVQLGLAIADTTQSWRSLGLLQTFWVGPKWKRVSYSFTAADDSKHAQFQLTRFKVGEYELDDLSFQSGAKSEFDTAKRLEDGQIPTVKVSDYAPPQAARDFIEFLIDTERRYWVGLSDYLKDELKVQPVISGTQLVFSPPFVQAKLDYVDIHSYWRHPSPVSPNWRIANDSMVNSMSCIRGLAGQRVLGKPYTVSEYNHPFPNQYGAEGQPMLRAYGRLQGWDGVFEYNYHHRPNFQPQQLSYFFHIIARTDVLAHFPACATIYLRGDVHEAKSTIVGAVDYAEYVDRLARAKGVAASIGAAGLDSRLGLIHKTAVDLTGKRGTDPATVKIPADQKVFVSDTGELTWNVEQAGAGYFTVNTANTKLFTGFPKGRMIELGDLTLSIGKTRLDWATVSLVSRHATGFGETDRPANILLAATGVSQNKDMKIEHVSDNTITLSDWGRGPVMAEGIPAVITLPADPARLACFALDPSGNRKQEVPVEKTDGGGSKIVLKPEYETVWYEIDIRQAN